MTRRHDPLMSYPNRASRNANHRPGWLDWRIEPTLTGMHFSIGLSGPLKVSYSTYSGELVVDAIEAHPHVKGGARWRLHLSASAARELIQALSRVGVDEGAASQA